jgi:hypothetical protein
MSEAVSYHIKSSLRELAQASYVNISYEPATIESNYDKVVVIVILFLDDLYDDDDDDITR